MRSTLARPRLRCCPMCDNRGFKRIADDFFRQPIFRCHACGHEWTANHGPQQGTDTTPPAGRASLSNQEE